MKGKIKEIFSENIGMKLLSLGIGALLWIVIMSISDPQVTRTIQGIPVERRNEEAVSQEGMVYESLSGNRVDIRVHGSRSVVEGLSAADFTAYVDFREIGWVNAVPIHVVTKDKELDAYIEVTHQSHDVMSISLVEYLEDMAMVEVRTSNVPEGYYAFCSSVSSKLLEVSGSKTQVEMVDRLLGVVDLTGRTKSFQTTVSLKPVTIDGTEIDSPKLSVAQNYVQVDITILPVQEISIAIQENTIPVAEGFGLVGVEYSPKTIQIAAEPELLASIQEIIIPYPDSLPLMQSEEVEIDIQRYLPDGVYLKSESSTMVVSVGVELLAQKQLVLTPAQIELRNLPEQFEATITIPEFSLTLTGLQKVLDALTAQDLSLYLDMSSCEAAGTYSVLLKSERQDVAFSQKVPVVVTEKATEAGSVTEEGTENGSPAEAGNVTVQGTDR